MPGALIVLIAIMLDRTTTAASQRGELIARGGGGERPAAPEIVLGIAGVATLVAIWLSRYAF